MKVNKIFEQEYITFIKEKRKNRNVGHYQIHHVIPKRWGGADTKANMVLLTPAEHTEAHWLLWKAYQDKGDYDAFLSCAKGESRKYDHRDVAFFYSSGDKYRENNENRKRVINRLNKSIYE